MIRPTVIALAAASSIAVSAFTYGCSATPSADGATTAPTPGVTMTAVPSSTTASVDAAATVGQCTEASIRSSLPNGTTLQKFQCALGSPYMWAAARAEPGDTVVFMRSNNGPWVLVDTQLACERGPSSAPAELASMCPKNP